jgi:hypothetical protein
VSLLDEMNAARLKMIETRKQLDDYATNGVRAYQKHTALSRTLMKATDDYISLVAQFLHQQQNGRK